MTNPDEGSAPIASENDTPNASTSENHAPQSEIEQKLIDLAENFGRLVGTAEQKATLWFGKREEIAAQLTQIRDTCNTYLRDLAGGGTALADAVRRGRREGAPAPTSETPTSTSAEGNVEE